MSEQRLPEGLAHVRTTPEFTADTVPQGLLRSHHIASGVWGVLRVLEGSLTFVFEGSAESRDLVAPATQVIEPNVPHHVEPGPTARFLVEFHR